MTKIIPPSSGARTLNDLSVWKNATLEKICGMGFYDLNTNHCAHYVSHVFNLRFGVTCNQMVNKSLSTGLGCSIRVYEIFNAARPNARGLWADAQNKDNPCLIYITDSQNYLKKSNSMQADYKKVHSKEHVGIYFDNKTILNFSNGHKKVITRTIEEFVSLYGTLQTDLLYSEIPRISIVWPKLEPGQAIA